jgi:hypothetical protein
LVDLRPPRARFGLLCFWSVWNAAGYLCMLLLSLRRAELVRPGDARGP